MNELPEAVGLERLHFDLENPRYGRRAGEAISEARALDMIVTDFLVDDLLSSISANGFFNGEPLIVKSLPGRQFKVLEGNRRLTALLILANDPRAEGQRRRGDIFRAKLAENGHEVPTQAPVVRVDDAASAKQALAYLGTKHIVGARAWDSYAKAMWMAEMRQRTDLPMQQIREMIGDTSGLVDRMLEGYYFVEQLRNSGHFDGSQSHVKGRGSNPEFPFSWIYTALSYSGIRKFLHLGGLDDPHPDPINAEHLGDAAALMRMMFGDRNGGNDPVIEESRDLADLAQALLNPAMSSRLRDGDDLATVQEEGKPLTERLAQLVGEAGDRLRKANGLVSTELVTLIQARELDSPTLGVAKSAQTLRRTIKEIIDQVEASEIE